MLISRADAILCAKIVTAMLKDDKLRRGGKARAER
jgi:hypothetical protein